MRAVIGVDIGTQGTKTALFDESGRQLASAFRDSSLYRPAPGIVEEDPERQVMSVCETIAECVAKSRVARSSVSAIAIDGQMAGVLGVGCDGRHVTAYDSWLDTRCADYITRMNRVAGEEVLARTGGPASFNHGPKILWWMHERSKIFRAIRSFVQPGAYAAMRLCGLASEHAFIDKTYLHFSGFANNVESHWDVDLCSRFGLDPEKLPAIVDSHAIVGQLTKTMSRECRLSAGVPVVAGCGDTAASFLACGATREGICVDVAGTASVFAATTRSFLPDQTQKVLSCARAVAPGFWHSYAYINGGGMNLVWFQEQIARGSRSQAMFRKLDRQAARIPLKGDQLFFIPHMGGRVSPAWPRLRGAWVNLNWTDRVPDLWRSMLESTALEYCLYKHALLRLMPRFRLSELRITGGGEKSALWNQIKADVMGIPVVQIAKSHGAPAGAALLAAYGVGLVKSLSRGTNSWVVRGRVTRPDARTRAHYESRLKLYESLLTSLGAWNNV